ncbi:MAG: dicarboxylate/amino acid:cation symporter [Vulcanimicrobiota bacterium]
MTEHAPADSHPQEGTSHGASWLLPAIIVGVILGGLVGAQWPQFAIHFEFFGELFLNALKMLIVPLVASSMIAGIASLGDVRKLGKPGLVTVLLYAATTALAVFIGMIFVNLLKPGAGVQVEGSNRAPATRLVKQIEGEWVVFDKGDNLYTLDGEPVRAVVARFKDEHSAHEAAKEGEKSLFGVVAKVMRMMVSANIIQSAAATDILPLIFFSLLFGGVLTTLGQKGQMVLEFFAGVSEAMMAMVNLIMYVAPLGIFSLIAARLGKAGGGSAFVEEVTKLGNYALCVILALLVHSILLIGLYALLARRSPVAFLAKLAKALTTAFSTASSSATLPLTMECCEEAGVSPEATSFVLPLGATVNMNGTALYESVAAIFIAQAFGIPLGMEGQLIVFVTATLAAIGAAGIPEAGLVTMLIVLNAANLPTAGVGLLLSIDWFLDRCRTSVNVWGDAVVAGCVDEMVFSKLDLSGEMHHASSVR